MKALIIETIKKLLKNKIIIKYDMTNNYYTCYNEARGVAYRSSRLLKNPRTKTYNYTTYGLIYLAIAIIISIINIINYHYYGYSTFHCIINIILIFLYLYIFLFYFYYIIRLIFRQSTKVKGSFEITDEGIVDSTFRDTKIIFKWPRIKMLVIKKNTITILTDSPIYFFVNKELEEDLIKGIKKYKKKIIIVKD